MRDISEAITKSKDISEAAKDISDAVPEVPEFPLELIEQADLIQEEEQLGLMTEPQSFWEQLIYGQQRPPGAEAIPAGLVEIYKTAGIGRGGVWQPLGADIQIMTPEQRQKEFETFGVHKLIDITERPLYMAHNAAYISAKSIQEHGRFRPQEAPTFADYVKAAQDGLRGEQYGSTLDLVKMGTIQKEKLQQYNDFLQRHNVARYIDKAADIGTEIAAAAILEAGYYKGIRAVATKTPGLKTLISGMFDDVGKAYLHRGFGDAVDAAMEKSKLYQEVLERLDEYNEAPTMLHELVHVAVNNMTPEDLPFVEKYIRLAYTHGNADEMIKRAREQARLGLNPAIISYESQGRMVKIITAASQGLSTRDLNKLISESFSVPVAKMSEAAAKTWADQADEILRFVNDEGLTVKGVWPQNPSVRMMTEFAKELGAEIDVAGRALNSDEFLREIANVIHSRIPERLTAEIPVDDFIESFIRINSGRAKEVPAATAAKFLSIMRDAGVPYVDVTKVVERAMGVEYINALVKTKSITQDAVNKGVSAVSMGKKKTLKQLDDVELKSLMEDIASVKTVGKTKLGITGRIGLLGLPTGGPPPWKMFENFGIPHGYDLVDEAMSAIQNWHTERGSWMKDVMRRYEKQFGKKWDDLADQVAGRIADEGPSAIVPGRFAMMTDDEVNFIRQIVDEDRELFWNPLADRAESLGLIGEGTTVPRQQYYFHHRRKIIDSMIERARRKGEEITLGVLPSDYAVERIIKEKIPAGVNVPEFFARKSEEAIEYNWRATTSIAFREELRKLYLEPSLRRLDFILEEMPGAYRKEARKYAHDWIRSVRGIPSAWDDRLNDFNYAVMRRIPGLRNTWLASERGYEQMTKGMRRLVFTGTMGANTRTWIKNGFQSMLTVNTIGDKATYAGWESMFTDGGKRLLNNYRVMAGGRRLALSDITTIGKLERGMTLPFAAIDKYINCAGAGNGAVYYLMTRSKGRMDELAEYAVKKGYKNVSASNFWNVMADAVDDGLFKDVIDSANKNIKYTQWSYNAWDMPRHLWSQTGRTAWMFTTWPSNFFGAHLPQLWSQLVHGENVFGTEITMNQRLALIRYITVTTGMVALARKMGYNLDWMLVTGPAPTGRIHGWVKTPLPISPPTEFALSLGDVIVNAYTGDLKRLDTSAKIVARSIAPFVPAGTTIQRGIKWKKGEAPLEYIFLPKKLPPKRKVGLEGLEGFGGLKGLED